MSEKKTEVKRGEHTAEAPKVRNIFKKMDLTKVQPKPGAANKEQAGSAKPEPAKS